MRKCNHMAVGFSATLKIICQLYSPKIDKDKIIFAYQPTGTHERFIKENHEHFVKYLNKNKGEKI